MDDCRAPFLKSPAYKIGQKFNMRSLYGGQEICLATKHGKEAAISPPFLNILNATFYVPDIDTDSLGTFSGETPRLGTMVDAVKAKALMGMRESGLSYAVASEGSFGPHPYFPFVPAGKEILYFIDAERKFDLFVSDVCTETNYQMEEISSYEEALLFAGKIGFPSHAVIVQQNPRGSGKFLHKGIHTQLELEKVIKEAAKDSGEKKLWIESDMRAHMNPTRMRGIGNLAEKLATRLKCLCPKCSTPGWGIVDLKKGLPCQECGCATGDIKMEILGCAKCDHRQETAPAHGQNAATPGHCPSCNP